MAYTRQLPGLVVSASSGTITVNSYGAVGGRIEGVYSGTSGTRTLSGNFSVTREAGSEKSIVQTHQPLMATAP